MYWDIDLSADPASVRLQDIDNFRAFQIEARGPREGMAAAIEPYGRWEDDFAWFRPEAVREAAGPRGLEADWEAGFQALIEYAREHGYLADDGFIRAHVEWHEDAG